MPEDRDSTKKTRKEDSIKFIKMSPKDNVPYLQIYTVCGGIWIRDIPQKSHNMNIPANQKFLINTNSGRNQVRTFYLKTNTAYPSTHKCIGVQLVLFSISVNSHQLSEKEKENCTHLYERANGILPPYDGVRVKLIQDIILSNENENEGESISSKKVDRITHLTTPNNSVLLSKIGDIFKVFRNSSSNFDSKDLLKRTKGCIENLLKFHYQNLKNYHPIDITKQTLKFMLKTIQDIANKKE